MTPRPPQRMSAWLERALPQTQREAFARQLVAYQIEELNGLGDRLRYVAEANAPEREQHAADASARIGEIVEALGWNAEEVVRLTWEWLETPLEQPEDAFAPAVVLRALCKDEERLQRWLASLPEASRRALPGR